MTEFLIPGPEGGIEIVRKMIKVMRGVGAVAKLDEYNDKRGTQFNFRGVDAVVNAVGPILRREGVLPVTILESIERRDTRTAGGHDTKEISVIVRFRMYADDGSCVEYLVPGENLSRSDKGTAAAMSVAYRVLWLQALCIPTDDPDPDSQYLTREGRGELSPAQVENLLATLQYPDSELAEWPKLWAIVMDHDAADRPSPIVHEGRRLTWYEVFGQALAARFDAIRTPELWQHTKAAIQALGDSHGLTWAWGGVTPAARFSQRAKDILQLEQEMARVLDARIAEAASTADLDAAAEALKVAGEELKIHAAKAAELAAFLAARRVKIEECEAEAAREAEAAAAAEAIQPEPETPAAEGPWERSAHDPGVPEAEAVAAQDAATLVEQATEPVQQADTADQHRVYRWMAKLIETAEPPALPALTAGIDGEYERGKISGEQHAALHEQIKARLAEPATAIDPEAAPESTDGPSLEDDPYGAMIYAIAQCGTEEGLETAKATIADLLTGKKLTAKMNERLLARVAARRVELRKAAPKGPSLEEVP